MTPRTPIFRISLIGLAIFAALGLTAGCTDFREDWSAMPETREPTANLVRYAHTVHFVAGSVRLETDERAALDGFLARMQTGPTDVVTVVAHGGDGLAGRRRETVAAYLTHRAVRTQAGGDVRGAEAGPDDVSVTVQRYSVTLPACPDWSDRPGRSWNNTVSRNWGCATATNLGLMVVDPADLADGRRPGPMDGEAAVLAIQRYRAGETRPLSPEDVGTTQKQQKESGNSSGGGGQ